MLHDGSSPERYFQSMFRGQTPADGKTDFYVIDYNPDRMLCMNHFMIDEIPTGKKSISNNTKQDNIREWLKASEIIDIELAIIPTINFVIDKNILIIIPVVLARLAYFPLSSTFSFTFSVVRFLYLFVINNLIKKLVILISFIFASFDI